MLSERGQSIDFVLGFQVLGYDLAQNAVVIVAGIIGADVALVKNQVRHDQQCLVTIAEDLIEL